MAGFPGLAIAFIAFRPRVKFRVISHGVIKQTYASDHLPILSVLELSVKKLCTHHLTPESHTLLERLQSLSNGLCFPSESDYPFEVVYYPKPPEGQDLPALLHQWLGVPGDGKIKVEDLLKLKCWTTLITRQTNFPKALPRRNAVSERR